MKLDRLLTSRTSKVPPAEVATGLGGDLRRGYGAQAESPDFIADLLKTQGWIVREQTLDAARGGLQALMAPHEGGFLFVVDPSPSLEEQLVWAGADRNWLSERLVNQRLAHELCHVLFHGHNGRRLLPQSAAEEAFCDAFAAALVPISGPVPRRATAAVGA